MNKIYRICECIWEKDVNGFDNDTIKDSSKWQNKKKEVPFNFFL